MLNTFTLKSLIQLTIGFLSIAVTSQSMALTAPEAKRSFGARSPGSFADRTNISDRSLHAEIVYHGNDGWSELRGDPDDDHTRYIMGLAQDRIASGGVFVISYSGIPKDGDRTVDLARCARGDFASSYQKFGNRLRLEGLAAKGIVIRIAWEWDNTGTTNMGIGSKPTSTQLANFKACYANIVTNMRIGVKNDGVGRPLFDFNSSTGATTASLTSGYPGDKYVDIVSMEGYDNRGPGCRPTDHLCRWKDFYSHVQQVSAFGKARNKLMAFPEWALWELYKDDGKTLLRDGNNPVHVENLCKFAKEPANRVHYFSYFYSGVGDRHDIGRFPSALAAMKANCL